MADFNFVIILDAVPSGRTLERDVSNYFAKIKNSISSFCYAFRQSDNCCLTVVIRDSENAPSPALVTEVLRWVAVGRKHAFFDAPAPVDILTESMATSVGAIVEKYNFQIDTFFSPQALFQIYLDTAGYDHVSDYEFPRVVDLYDLNCGLIHQKLGDGFVSRGVTPKIVYDCYQYIVDQDNGIRSMIDVGCGAGQVYGLLRGMADGDGQAFPQYVGLDYSRGQVFRAKNCYPEATFHPGSADYLPFADRQFDFVFGFSVIPFMLRHQQVAALDEMLRISDKGAFITFAASGSPNGLPTTDVIQDRYFDDFAGRTQPNDFPPLDEVLKTVSKYSHVEAHLDHRLYVKSDEGVLACTPRIESTTYSAVMGDVDEFKENNGVGFLDGKRVEVVETVDVYVTPESYPIPFQDSSDSASEFCEKIFK